MFEASKKERLGVKKNEARSRRGRRDMRSRTHVQGICHSKTEPMRVKRQKTF
jgi:hypothetical protein